MNPEQDTGILLGRNPVLEALKSGRTLDKLLIAKGELGGSINQILRLAREADVTVQIVDRVKLEMLARAQGVHAHQGVAAYLGFARAASIEDIVVSARDRQEPPFIVVLDGITDPYNVGSVLRSAECLGAHGVVIPRRRSAGVNAAAAKASSGAVMHMPVARVNSLLPALAQLKNMGLWVAGADTGGTDSESADLTGPLALVIGAEGEGLSHSVRESCDFLVRIAMGGQIQSLNASVAAAVLMYERRRQVNQKADAE
ncbi:MAG: 23S rRNA (guanosine(2251)-2'-O)-methyltransferase RlmB [Bacillota bacterium]